MKISFLLFGFYPHPYRSQPAGLVVAAADLDGVDPFFGKHHAGLDGIVEAQTALIEILTVHFDQHRVPCSDSFADSRQHLQQQAGAVGDNPSPGVFAPVEKRRQKLAEQIPVGGMDLDPVKTGVFCPRGGGGKSLDHRADILAVHLPRSRFGDTFHDRRPLRLRAGRRQFSQHPRVGQLHHDLAAVFMHDAGHGLQFGDQIVAVNPQLPDSGLALRAYIGMAADNQPHAAPGQGGHQIG